MIAAPGLHLAAEHPIGPRRIAENQRDQHGDAEQHEDLAVLRRGRLPDGDALRHDIGIHADAEAGIGQREQAQRQEERLVVLFPGEAAQQQNADAGDRDRHRRGQDDVRPGEPALRILHMKKRRGDADQRRSRPASRTTTIQLK